MVLNQDNMKWLLHLITCYPQHSSGLSTSIQDTNLSDCSCSDKTQHRDCWSRKKSKSIDVSPGCNPEPGRQTHLHSSVPLHLEILSFNFCLVLENSNHPGKSKSTWKVSLPFLRKPNRGITNHINKLFIQCFKITCVAQLTIERGKVICSNFGQFPKR